MKKVFLFIAIGLLLLAIPATIFFLGQQRDLRAKAAPATTLALTPATTAVKVGDEVKVAVQMNPGANQVVTAKIYLTYDATKLTGTGATNGVNAPRILNSGIFENGTASITVGAASNAQPITTAGPIAVFTFTTTNPTTAIAPAAILFASNTFVGGLGETTANVLVGTTGAKISITGTGTTPALTPTLAPSGTPSATLTPTLAPTLPASGSAEATASALTILPTSENGSSVSARPVIRVKAPPGSTVTIVFHSEEQTCVTVTDADGYASCSPDIPLDPGLHEITASIDTASGSAGIATESIVVGTGGGGDVMPVSGNVDMTILLLTVGMLFVIAGSLIPVFIQ